MINDRDRRLTQSSINKKKLREARAEMLIGFSLNNFDRSRVEFLIRPEKNCLIRTLMSQQQIAKKLVYYPVL